MAFLRKMKKIKEFSVRLVSNKNKEIVSPISDYLQAIPFIIEEIGYSTIEKAMLLCMGYDYDPIGYSLIGIGNSDKIIIDVAELFRIALLSNAKNIIIAHNHLGTSLIPTDSYILATKRIGNIGNILGIKLIDSIIVNSLGDSLSIRKYLIEKGNADGLE